MNILILILTEKHPKTVQFFMEQPETYESERIIIIQTIKTG